MTFQVGDIVQVVGYSPVGSFWEGRYGKVVSTSDYFDSHACKFGGDTPNGAFPSTVLKLIAPAKVAEVGELKPIKQEITIEKLTVYVNEGQAIQFNIVDVAK